MKTHKILEIRHDGFWVECIRDMDQKARNPFRVYKRTFGHRKLLNKYADFGSVLHFISQCYTWGFAEIERQIKEKLK